MAMRVVILREGLAMEAFKQVISFLFILLFTMVFTMRSVVFTMSWERNWKDVEMVI